MYETHRAHADRIEVFAANADDPVESGNPTPGSTPAMTGGNSSEPMQAIPEESVEEGENDPSSTSDHDSGEYQ